MPKEPRCSECGSADVLFDAYAAFNPATNAFELFNAFDKGTFCQCCDGGCSVRWQDRNQPAPELTD